MRILVTGHQGYIGSILTRVLIEVGYDVVGFDIGYYEDCILTNSPASFTEIRKDIREIGLEDLKKIDAIIHLAGLSNDPVGELAPSLTQDINYESTIQLAKLAKESSVRRFVYASSQSMYGISTTDGELDEEESEKNPITAYARTKWDAELVLRGMHSVDFVVSCFRPSTVFGVSPRLRCDVVFNNLVACAFTTGKIEIYTDGTPWRPVVHVRDVCQAFIAGLEAPAKLIGGQAYNVGIPNGNFTVRDLAEAAQRAVPGSQLVFLNEHTDPRTYRVGFEKILTELQDFYQPEWDLNRGGEELVSFFKAVNFTEGDFRGKNYNRLRQLEYLQATEKLNGDLAWM